jgi:hypothetical protein
MEKYTSKLINRWVLYNLSMMNPFLALLVVSILDYEKEKDNLLDRIKLISIYEILNLFVILLFYFIFGISSIKFTIIGLVLFYSVICGIKAFKKKDFFTRGLFLGILSCYFCLAIINTSNDSTARTDDATWPDIGLSVILMVNKLIYILPIYFLINKLDIIIDLLTKYL